MKDKIVKTENECEPNCKECSELNELIKKGKPKPPIMLKHEHNKDSNKFNDWSNNFIVWTKNFYYRFIKSSPKLLLLLGKYLTLPTLVIISSVGLVYKTIPTAYADSPVTIYETNVTTGLGGIFGLPSGYGGSEYIGETWLSPNTNYICSITLSLAKHGTPSDGIYINLYDNSGNGLGTRSPGTLLASTTTVLGSSMTTSAVSYNFTFSNCQYLTGGQVYYLDIERSGSLNATNYYQRGGGAGHPDTSTMQSWAEGFGSWIENGSEDYFKILGYYSLNTSSVDSNVWNQSMSTSTVTSLKCNPIGFNSSTLQDIGCAMFYVDASSTGVIAINSAFSSYLTIFPFNIFFNYNSILSTLTTNYTVSDNTITWTFHSPINNATDTISFSSSTLNTYLGSGTWGTIRTWEDNALWILLILGILTTLGVWIQNIKPHKQ